MKVQNILAITFLCSVLGLNVLKAHVFHYGTHYHHHHHYTTGEPTLLGEGEPTLLGEEEE